MNKYHLKVAHRSSQLTIIVVEKKRIHTSLNDTMIWHQIEIEVEAVVVKNVEEICAFDITGKPLELEKLVGNVQKLKAFLSNHGDKNLTDSMN